ncbi:sensor histidine kinase [Lichenicoccus sp.]|uniref:sensor histidine kinase n=1 Tax=Lichenicoccus sp. TaxID=2781899 RepID=UPI003D0DEF2F
MAHLFTNGLLMGSLRGRLVGSMTLLLIGGLALVYVLEHGAHAFGGRFAEDQLGEPWQDLAILAPFSLVMLVLIGVVTRWSLRPLLRASDEAAAAGPQRPEARIGMAGLPSELRPLVGAVNDTLDRLTAAYETERRFTADAAHELRTPLAALGLRLQRARSEGAAIEWPAIEADLAVMRRLIEGLLDLARKEAGGAQPTPVNLSRIVREAAATIEPLVQAAGRTLEVSAPDRLAANGHPDDLRDMVRTLAQNALTHGRGRIRLTLARQAANAVLEVDDQGPAIAAADGEALFERFRKGAQSGSGSGLGLSIARAVVRAHGGSVGFTGGSGCTIRVTLPASAPTPPQALTPATRYAHDG